MTVIAKVINKLQQYQQNMREEGLIVGLGINFEDIVGKLYLGLIFHRLDGTLGGAAKIRGKKNIHIGAHFTCGKYVRIEAIKQYNEKNSNVRPQIVIKDNVSFNDFTHIGAVNYVEIGNHVLFGSKCYVTDHNHGIYSGAKEQSNPNIPPAARLLTSDKKVIIEDNVWLGDNVVVLPGVTIGKGSIIGANSVVSKSIPPYSIAVGAPACVIKKWDFSRERWEY